MRIHKALLILFLFISAAGNGQTLKLHPGNFRYFTDGFGRAIVLTGAHAWMRKPVNKHWVADGWDLEKIFSIPRFPSIPETQLHPVVDVGTIRRNRYLVITGDISFRSSCGQL